MILPVYYHKFHAVFASPALRPPKLYIPFVELFDSTMQLSIVIGLLNEDEIVKTNIRKLHSFTVSERIDAEIILVNDGSTDSTEKKLQELEKELDNLRVISYQDNKCKGYAIKQGALAAKGDYVLYTDIDLAYPIEQILFFLREIKERKIDCLVGSRVLLGSKYIVTAEAFKTIYFRHMISRVFNFMSRKLFKLEISDTQCGFKCFDKKLLKKVVSVQRINGFAFDVELLVITNTNGFKIYEVPVTVQYSLRNSKVRILRQSIKMFVDLLRIKYHQMVGRYALQ